MKERMLTIRYWLIRRLAGSSSILLNAHLDGRGCILPTPALVAGCVLLSGTKLFFRTEEGALLPVVEEKVT